VWILVLFKKGPKALFGYDQVVVHQFENALLYKNAVFSRIILPGIHWTWLKNRTLIKVDTRPEVIQIAQGTVTSDHFPVLLRCIVRIQVRDPKKAIESSQNYRQDAQARLQSIVKMIGKRRSFRQLHLSHDEFDAIAQKLATEAIAEIGCECLGFELLQVESAGTMADLEDKRIGFGAHFRFPISDTES